jgi:hypothetical protein
LKARQKWKRDRPASEAMAASETSMEKGAQPMARFLR